MVSVLFVCKDNQMHSQIAECICKFLGSRVIVANSCGLHKGVMQDNVIALLSDIYNINIQETQYPKSFSEIDFNYDIVVAINIPFIDTNEYIEYWNVSEQLSENLVFEIEEKVMQLLHDIKLGNIK